jgi:hypothetical protein
MNMASFSGRVRQLATRNRSTLIGGACLVGLMLLFRWMSELLGLQPAAQILATFLVPALVMVGYWRVARARLLARETEFDTAILLEKLANRASSEFLVGVAHEIVVHRNRCSLRAEALAVAVDYRELAPDLKIAVPDVVVFTDPHLLRHILHILVGNAVRHGGSRVALWAAPEKDLVKVTVSDDGPGLPPDIGARVFERYLDLLEQSRLSRPSGTGLPIARTLSDLIGGQINYRRDPSWTHFSISLPLANHTDDETRARLPVQAQTEAAVR